MQGWSNEAGRWPFAARHEELRFLGDVVRSGVDDPTGPAGAVVVAPAGVGKTRLLAECRAALGSWHPTTPTVSVIATRSARLTPYSAVAHLAPDVQPEAFTDPFSWHRTIAATFRGDGQRPVLFVDDAHLLDDGSAALVLYLAQSATATVIAAVRRGPPSPDPITALWRDGIAKRLDLTTLSQRETEGLVTERFGGAIDRHTVHRLAAVSRGNVLFVRELVEGACRSGAMHEVDGIWRWDGVVPPEPRLLDAVGHRLVDLPGEERTAIAGIALGEPLSQSVASALFGEAVLARVEGRGLISVDADDGDAVCYLAHPLYGEVVLAQLGEVERRSRMRDLIAACEAADLPGDDVRMRLSRWRLDTGDAVSSDELVFAARHADRSFDHRLTERLARAALDRGAGPHAAVLVARALLGQERADEAEEMLMAAESAILAEHEVDLHQLYLDRRFQALYRSLQRRDETLAMLDRFEDSHRDADDAHAIEAHHLVAGFRANVLLDEGRLDEALAVTAPVLAADDVRDLSLLHALEASGEALAYRGQTDATRELVQRMRELGSTGRHEVRQAPTMAVLQEMLCLSLEGRVAEAIPMVTQVYDQTRSDPESEVRGLVALVLGALQLQQGTVSAARRSLFDASAAYAGNDIGGARSWALALSAQASALLGDAEQARRQRDESVACRPAYRIVRMELDFALADAHVARIGHDATTAVHVLDDVAEQLGEVALHRARALHLAACIGPPSHSRAAQLRAIADASDGPLPQLFAEQAEALAARDAPALESIGERYGERSLWLRAAEASAQASVAFREAAIPSGSARTAARSRAWCSRCEGARFVGFDQLGEGIPLSRREHEVAKLAASGLSNGDIAQRLGLSVRTIESHLYQAFGKLGAERRADLNALLTVGDAWPKT